MTAGGRKYPTRPSKSVEQQKLEFHHYVAFAILVIILAAIISRIPY